MRRALTDLLSRIIHVQLDNAKLVKEYASDATYIQIVTATVYTWRSSGDVCALVMTGATQTGR